MAHLVLAAPPIAGWALHGALVGALEERGHRITVLATDPANAAFHASQKLHVVEAAGRAPAAAQHPLARVAPVAELAELEVAVRGSAPLGFGGWRAEARAAAELRRLVAPAIAALCDQPVDLLVVPGGRGGSHRLLHFLARGLGIEVVHVGQGLMPGTMQIDRDGLDGDASVVRRTAGDYRDVAARHDVVEAALAAWLANLRPLPAPRVPLRVPSLPARLVAAARTPTRFVAALDAWREALPPVDVAPPAVPELPGGPLLAVLLQHPADVRLRLDARQGPMLFALAHAARAAAQALHPRPELVLVDDARPVPGSLARALLRDLPGARLVPATAAPQVLLTAVAAITVNHPLGLGALLAGTPVVSLGRSPYAVPGVVARADVASLPRVLAEALAAPPADLLRARFLTRYLLEDTIWCDALAPDFNGIQGVVEALETHLPARARGPQRYRPGPAWPLHRVPRGGEAS